MSNIPMDVLLDHAGSDYDDLPDDVKRMVDEAETVLAGGGVDVAADLSATNDADELPTDAGPTSTSKPATDNVAIPSFTSRGKARTYASSNGLRVIDNGAGVGKRWTVGPKTSTAKAPAKRKARTAPAVAVKPGTKKTVDKKALAIQTYRALEGAGELKRSTFLAAMEIHGLGAKGASSYFYRIKGGTW